MDQNRQQLDELLASLNDTEEVATWDDIEKHLDALARRDFRVTIGCDQDAERFVVQSMDQRWTSARAVNRSGAVLIVDGMREYTIAEAARESGIPAAALRTRHLGWPVHEALTRPPRRDRRQDDTGA
jgi:hypothetical protein